VKGNSIEYMTRKEFILNFLKFFFGNLQSIHLIGQYLKLLKIKLMSSSIFITLKHRKIINLY